MKVQIREVKDDFIQYTTLDERWYVRKSDGRRFSSSTWITGYCYKGKGWEDFLKLNGENADKIRDDAGDRGNKIHQAIHLLLHRYKTEGRGYVNVETETFMNESNGLYEELNAEEAEGLYWFCQWWDELNSEHDVELIDYEEQVFNEELGYAGTRDLRLKIDGEFWTIDYKTGKNIYNSHKAQLASYKHTPGCEGDRLGILQVPYLANKKKRYKFTEIPDCFHLFLAAYEFWKEENEFKEPKQYMIPRLIEIKPKQDELMEQLTESINHEKEKRNGSKAGKR